MPLWQGNIMRCADTGRREPGKGRHGGRTFDELVRTIAGRPGGEGDRSMILLSCLIEQGIEDALDFRPRLAPPQRVLLRSIEKT